MQKWELREDFFEVSDLLFPDENSFLIYDGNKGILFENFEGNWGKTAVIDDCAGYDAKNDRILMSSYLVNETENVWELAVFPDTEFQIC